MLNKYSLTLEQVFNIVGSNKVTCKTVKKSTYDSESYYNLRCYNSDCSLSIGWKKGTNNYFGSLAIIKDGVVGDRYPLDQETVKFAYNHMINIVRVKYGQEEARKDSRLDALLNKYSN